MRSGNNKGTTLLEMLTVVAVLSVLFALSIPLTGHWRKGAQYKAASREILSTLRRARSVAIHENRSVSFSINLDDGKYTADGDVTFFPDHIKIESKDTAAEAWSGSGIYSISFRPQGNANKTIFIRVNQDSDLVIMVDSKATGLAHM
ncbi:GspH/FimT family pseudopilin [Syntrophotalea acetylenica]|uniref:GspH/FimT family pseudopilin n=1 Tax=Syntrophotalea acetylenica TaxID=29542 RepID=UPI000AF9019B|nr:GspH/FimT family pseudopilin [Syntrophotalea acetylenica]